MVFHFAYRRMAPLLFIGVFPHAICSFTWSSYHWQQERFSPPAVSWSSLSRSSLVLQYLRGGYGSRYEQSVRHPDDSPAVVLRVASDVNGGKSSENEKQGEESSKEEAPLFSFGVLADIQYAPIPAGFSYGGVPRFYDNSIKVARQAALHYQSAKVDLVTNLGDIIDGKCQTIEREGGLPLPEDDDRNPGERCIDNVLLALSAYDRGSIIHTYGNHELYNLKRTELGPKLGIPFRKESGSGGHCDLVGYRSIVHKGIRFVVMDTYDISLMDRDPTTSVKRQTAEQILKRENPNYHRNPNAPDGLEGVQRRFVAFNGAVDRPQLRWLRETLDEARTNGEKVIVLSHQPILPGSSSPMCLVWNYEEVLSVLRPYADVIVCALAGHAHKGGYKRCEKSGIHFRVLEAVLENVPATYGIAHVYDDRLVIEGYGNCTSGVYDMSHMSSKSTASLQEREPISQV